MKKILLLFLFVASVCFGDIEISEDVRWYDSARDFFFSISASESMTESVVYIFPVADATVGGQALLSDGSGVMSWGTPSTSAAHNLMSGTHSDTTNSTPPARGSMIYGNATPKWDELTIGAANEWLKSDGTDFDWEAIDLGTDTTGNYVASVATTSPITGGAGGSEGAAITIDITVAKDIVAGVGLSGGENNVLPGADADTTLTFDATELDAIIWSDAANASNTWTFDVSGTDTTITFGNDNISFDFFSWTNPFNIDGSVGDITDLTISATLEAYWRFEQDLLDSSGNDRDVFVNGTEIYRNRGSKFVRSYNNTSEDEADGTGAANAYTGVTGTAARAVSAWVKSSSASGVATIVAWGNLPNTAQTWHCRINAAGAISIGTADSARRSDNGEFAYDGEWHHLVFQVDDNLDIDDTEIWCDGVRCDTTTSLGSGTAINTTNSANIHIGSQSGLVGTWDGEIVDVGIFSDVLSEAEIVNIFNAQKEKFIGGTQAGQADMSNSEDPISTTKTIHAGDDIDTDGDLIVRGSTTLGDTTGDSLGVIGASTFGNPTMGNDDIVAISNAGVLTFRDAAGLHFGGFWGNDLGDVILGTAFGGGFVIVSNAGVTTGELNLTTFQNDQEVKVSIEGRYLVVYSASVEAGVNQHIVSGIGIGGAVQDCGQTHSVMSAGASETNLSSTAILDLAADDTVSVMIDNESGNATPVNDVTVEHISLSLIQVGGT